MSDPHTQAAWCNDSVEFGFDVRRCPDCPSHIVRLWGELDGSSWAAALDWCASPLHQHVVIDMAGLTFMDCAGYGALVAAANELHARHGSLSLIDPAGQPLRMLQLIRSLGLGPCCPVLWSSSGCDEVRPELRRSADRPVSAWCSEG